MIDMSDKISVERVSPSDKHCFFGYYDISPESPDGKKILLNIAPFNDHMPSDRDRLTVAYIDEVGDLIEIASTVAWNFQEGCRAQWLDDNEIIYNVINGGHIESEVYSLSENKVKIRYKRPIYSVNNAMQKATSYNLYRSRYCYPHEKELEMTDYNKDGIFVLDLRSGKSELVISLANLAKSVGADPDKTWVEHVVFNNDGNMFYFFHRWEPASGGFLSRFCVSDLSGNVTVLLDSGMCSHAGWFGNGHITVWARKATGLNSFQKNSILQKTGLWRFAVNIYHAMVKKPELRQKFTNEAYLTISTKDASVIKIDNREFISDGHESWSTDMRWMLTDTYPDDQNMRSLVLYDSKTDSVYLLGRFISYPEVGSNTYADIPGIRCDLHPKWSFREEYIYFDSTHEGYRALYRANVSEILR